MSVGLAALRDYVTAGDHERYSTLPEGFVRIDVTHSNLSQRWHDVLVFKGSTVQELKHKLFKKNGTHVDSMELFIRNGYGGGTIYMGDDSKSFEFYGACNGCEVHIRDTDPFSISANGALENLDLVPKYVMPDDVYDSLPNTLRAHIRAERAKNPNYKLKSMDMERTQESRIYTPSDEDRPPTPKNATEIFAVGSRCEVQPGGRRGVVKFFGPIAGLKGDWVGVDLDEPLGQNDGRGPDGITYFACKGAHYGCFVKHYNVQTGPQYVERDPFESSDDEI
jgi:tubulin-folding cofactor B